MSPGTRSREETVTWCPSRKTRASGAASFFKAARASSARFSWTIPRMAFKTDDGDDGRGVHPLAQQSRNDRSHDEQHDDEIVELFPQKLQETRAGRLGQLIKTILCLSLGDFRAGQPVFADFEMFENFFC